ncbi:MAG: Mucin 2 precursor [Myxococcaceae bacterium]|nr:Mucin 2 precursor [Myxococcaceae bacterium]
MTTGAKHVSRIHPLAILGTALVTVIVVLVNYISARRYERWDLTRDQLFTLSERTGSLLTALDRPVDLYVFMSNGEPTFQDLRELLARYRARTDKLTVHFVDPDREPARFKLLSEKYGVRSGAQENGQTEAELAALVVSGEKRWSITRDDLVDVDFDSLEGGKGGAGAKINVKTEQALSGAIVQVTSGRATKVCISDGHGEWSLTDSADRPLAAVKEELKRENVELETIATRGKSELPSTCDALFVLGPQKAFAAEESAALDKYLAAGGNVLLALDPVIEGDAVSLTGFESLAQKHGLRLDRDVLVELDREHLLSPSPVEALLVRDYGSSPVVRALAAMRAPVVLQLARTVDLAAGATQAGQVLLSASDKAYGETQLGQLTAGDDLQAGEGDVKSPVHVAALVDTKPDQEGAPKQLGGRLIVIGDSDWLQPELLHQPQLANVDLLASFTGFLTERQALISIAPRKVDAQAMMITEEDLFSLLLRVVFVMPLAALILGVGVWWQRRA